MNRITVASLVAILLFSLGGMVQASNRQRPTPKDKLIPLPKELQETFDSFCSLINAPPSKEKLDTVKEKLNKHLLPGAFRVIQSGYRKKPWKDEVNLPFFFIHKKWDRVHHITKLSDQCFHILTENTHLYFVETAANEWRLYKLHCFSEWKQ